MSCPFLMELWRRMCRLPLPVESARMPELSELRQTEWDETFEKLMRNRLIMGAFRSGRLRSKGKKQFDRIESAITRLQRYHQSGNLEYLVDVANLCLLEFVEGKHPKKHFEAIDDGIHVKLK